MLLESRYLARLEGCPNWHRRVRSYHPTSTCGPFVEIGQQPGLSNLQIGLYHHVLRTHCSFMRIARIPGQMNATGYVMSAEIEEGHLESGDVW